MSILSTSAALLARAQFYAGHVDAAEHWADRANELGAAEDVMTQILWRQAKALVLAQRGEAAESARLLDEAVGLGESTHSPVLLADVYYDMGTALASLGQREKAGASFGVALDLYQPKENFVMAARTRARLAELGA
jgi:tetratricopeptide (TPR) repeat protein